MAAEVAVPMAVPGLVAVVEEAVTHGIHEWMVVVDPKQGLVRILTLPAVVAAAQWRQSLVQPL